MGEEVDMKSRGLVLMFALLIAVLQGVHAEGTPERHEQEIALDTPCLTCHFSVSPGIVESWDDSRHAASDIGCLDCHAAREGDPSGKDHFGETVTAVPSPLYCAVCHAEQVAQNARSKHAWGAFMGNLKPYYTKARELGLDPTSQETARALDPEGMAKTAVTPLFPDSGILKKIGFLDNPAYHHNNVNMGCAACHGSFILVEEDGSLSGWPNAGVGRVNPDGSLGACTYCHSRHEFSVAEARKPDSCGQCHLGPDHPQHEIYTESKHGNIFAASGEEWSWDTPVGEWGPDDITSPTCATCHMASFGPVKGSHDVGARLHWELQPPRSVQQWKGPDEVDLVLERVPDPERALAGRQTMKSVCLQCHTSPWVDGYFEEFDKIVSDYNMMWDYVDGLVAQAYEEGLISREFPVDETPEILHYLVWHHDGRRWRMGASMMGPDWTHWNGAVDTIMIKVGALLNDLELRRYMKQLLTR
jgi:hypothetical protein